MHIALEDGVLIATSKFGASEKRIIRIFNEYPSGRYDDDRWHSVVVIRTLTLVGYLFSLHSPIINTLRYSNRNEIYDKVKSMHSIYSDP